MKNTDSPKVTVKREGTAWVVEVDGVRMYGTPSRKSAEGFAYMVKSVK